VSGKSRVSRFVGIGPAPPEVVPPKREVSPAWLTPVRQVGPAIKRGKLLPLFPVFRFATPDLKTDPEEKQSLQKIF
jgi:hypothetical protein